MRDRIIHIIIWLLLIGSGLFVVLSVLKIQENRNEQQRAGLMLSHLQKEMEFDLHSVVQNLTPYFLDHKLSQDQEIPYYALIVINPTVCSACILEVHELIDVLTAYNEAEILPVIVVSTSDSIMATNFLQRTRFQATTYWGVHDALKELTTIMSDYPLVEQLLAFVDLPGNRIVFRSVIPTIVTSPAYKQNLIEEMLSKL